MQEDLNSKALGMDSGRSIGSINAAGIYSLLDRLQDIEKKDKVIGLVASMSFAVVLTLALMWWFGRAGLVMGIVEPEWKTIAVFDPGADYGTDNLGSSDINNFRDPSPNASDNPPSNNASNNAASSSNNSETSADPAAKGNLTQVGESPSESPTGKPDGSPTGSPTGSGSDQPKNNNDTGPNGGGSNDGETDKVGNTGHPDAKVLNENGLFTFGNGIGGAGGRKPLKTELKGYNVQLEEKIKFEITIDPNGDVIFVRALGALHQELVDIGKENIRRWKFDDTDPSVGNLKTTVTISFKLK